MDTYAHPYTYTPVPTATATHAATPLYADDFSDSGSGWPIGVDANGRYGYLNGEYQIVVTSAPWYLATTPGVRCSDCVIETKGRSIFGENGALGILFGITESWNMYIFQVGVDQHYSLVCATDEGWTYLIDWTPSPHLNAGTATNQIRVVRSGTNIALYANGHYLTAISDGTLLGSLRVGLAAIAYEAPNVEARFDDFAIYATDVGIHGAGVENQITGGPASKQ